ncbi:MAG TPA: J domain-containing protein [bacterium]|nr:J domain-containing protein [bacterium]
MSRDPHDDAVLSLDEVFKDEEVVSLSLSDAEWEVIIALAETGGSSTVEALRKMTRMDSAVMQDVIKRLLDRSVISRGSSDGPAEAGKSAPDAEVAQYLEFLKDLNHYQVLQLNPDADPAAIRRSYFRLMREYNPDRFMKEQNPDTREQLKEIFRILTRAYETLSDQRARREYDLTIPDFTGALEKEDDVAFDALWSGEVGPGPLPETNPDLAKSFYESGIADFQKGDHAGAELNFKLAVALDPKKDGFQAALAKARRMVQARQAKDAALKAIYIEDEGKFGPAIKWMSRAVELDNETPEYRYDLARMIEAHGRDLNAARMNVLLALDRKPGKLDYLILFAKIQTRLSEFADARRTYKKILSLDPGNEVAKKAMEELKRK